MLRDLEKNLNNRSKVIGRKYEQRNKNTNVYLVSLFVNLYFYLFTIRILVLLEEPKH